MSSFGLRGEFEMFVKDAATGRIKRRLHFANTILDVGMDGIGYNWSTRGACSVGTNNTPPSTSQTGLIAPHATVNALNGSGTQIAADPNNGYMFGRSYTYRFDPGQITAAISEVGIHSQAAINGSIRYFCRTLIKDENDNPSTITVLPNEYLDVIHTVFVIPDTQDVTFSFSLDGVIYTGTSRPSMIQSWGFFIGQGFSSNGWAPTAQIRELYYNENAQLGEITGEPTTTKTTLASIANYQRAAYTAGTYYTDTLCTFGVNYGNAPFKACIVRNVNITGQDCIGPTPCQIVFDKPIPKDNKTAFVLTVRRSWSRA